MSRLPSRSDGESGAASVEMLGILPTVALVAVVLWQLGVAGMTYVWTGHAASAAARSVALAEPAGEVLDAARDRMPAGMRGDLDVQVGGVDRSHVTVTSRVPLVAPGVFASPWQVEIDRDVVVEP